ncbi:uncharacterized protein LOC142319351 isoform X2 [Lycorma delicatula]|uniref:uncharacterized protein LOC142319351 isoform X2 n=1 Tax=Lycorma delicatula TaxID=130591 RepID=UPI003F517249
MVCHAKALSCSRWVKTDAMWDRLLIISTCRLDKDCVHLQLYRDSRDRYKQGQTKASLSLQHFLALETDQQFLIQIISVPPRAKIATGPAHLHVQEYRFSLTAGVPPRLLGCWEISQLRRYGAVEKRFCFEGGSRCGKGEGVYVLATDQSEEISRTLELAAEGKLMTRRRPVARNMSVMESSPRHSTRHARSESVQDSCACSPFPSVWTTPSESVPWPSSETHTDNTCDFGDSSSMEYTDTQSQSWQSERGMGRCVSCISKLGGPLTRSSTANTPGECRASSIVPPSCVSVSSCESGGSSEYSTPRLSANSENWMTSPPVTSEKCACCPPARPPKPSKLSLPPQPVMCKKPPMSTPPTCMCQHKHNAYNNYDVPRSIAATLKDDNRLSLNSSSEEYYDTPRSLRDTLQRTPPAGTFPVPVYHHCSRHVARCSLPCPCQRLLCCPESWLFSYAHCCGPESIHPVPVQKVRLSGTGKMPVNANGNIAIYATVDKFKKLKCKEDQESQSAKLEVTAEEDIPIEQFNQHSAKSVDTANYVNVEPHNEKTNEINDSVHSKNTEKGSIALEKTENGNELNYTNLEFAHSLQYYENAKDLLQKTGLTESDIIIDKFCSKCGHTSNTNQINNGSVPGEDYLLMEPAISEVNSCLHLKLVKPDEEESVNNKKCDVNHRTTNLAEKCSSAPSLAGAKLEQWQKQSSSEFVRIPGGTPMRLNQSLSAASSPYLKRHIMSCCPREGSYHFRRRSTSVESSRQSESTENDKSVVYSSQSVYETETSHCSENSVNSQPIELQIVEDVPRVDVPTCIANNKKSDLQKTVRVNNTEVSDAQDSLSSIVNIRRSSSVPCKSGNRDSSSSNDSGVSTGSLNHRGTDFAEFELPLSGKRHCHEGTDKNNSNQCLHNSLPRKSKSTDPLQELTFQFQKDVSPKSSSAEAEIPVCPVKRNLFKGCTSPDRAMLCPGLMDSRSNSSGTSDMSDYCETLSLSSYCSDTTDCLRLSHPAVTTLRPRSGKEYQKIDRFILESEMKNTVHSSGTDSHADKKKDVSPRP